MGAMQTTSAVPGGKPCAEVLTSPPITELYGAFLEAWRTREFAEAHHYLGRCRQAIEEHCGHDASLVALVRRIDALLTRRQTSGPAVDAELAEALVVFRSAMKAHLE